MTFLPVGTCYNGIHYSRVQTQGQHSINRVAVFVFLLFNPFYSVILCWPYVSAMADWGLKINYLCHSVLSRHSTDKFNIFNYYS